MDETTQTIPTLTTVRAMRDEILQLTSQYGASDVRVFGSVARGDSSQDSDIDLLVRFPENRSIFELVGLWLDLQDLLGRDVSLVPDGTPDQDFIQRILREAVAL